MELIKGTWGIILIWRLMKSLKNLFLLLQYVLCQTCLWIPRIQDLAIWLKADNYLLTNKIPLANKISGNCTNNNNNKFLLSGGHFCILCNLPKCLASGLRAERLQPGQSHRSAAMPTGDSSPESTLRTETGNTKSCSCYSFSAPFLPPQTQEATTLPLIVDYLLLPACSEQFRMPCVLTQRRKPVFFLQLRIYF